jgi:Tfp pilus assembly protein PilO
MLAGKRAPWLAGAGAAIVAILVIVVLVLPKMGQVSDAKKKLEEARVTTTNLESQNSALQDAKTNAPAAQAQIDKVDRLIPPTADLPGLILLLRNSADVTGVSYVTITPSTPVLDPSSGLSAISVTVTAEGTYFALTEYLYRIETLPRAAKVLGVTVGSSTTGTSASVLSMTATLVVYTADTSSGPGSAPGPQTGAGSTGTGATGTGTGT